MAKPITIPVASDTREFSSGVDKGVIKPLEGVDKALDDVAKGGDAAGDKLEHALDGARKETSEFKRDQTELGRVMAKTQSDGTQSLALGTAQRTKLSRVAIKQAGATAKQSIASDLQSMDGTAQGALGAIGNTVGGIFATLGPLGAGVGAAVGIATGLISGMVAKGAAETKKFKAEVAKLGGQFIETGRDSVKAVGPVVDKLKEMATTTEEGVITLQKLKDVTEGGAVSFADAAAAYAGNEEALKRVIKTNNDAIDNLYLLRDTEFTTSNNGDVIKGYDAKIEKAEQLGTYLNDTKNKIREAAAAEKLYVDSGAKEMEAKRDRIKSVDAAYDALVGRLDKYIDKEGNLNPAKFIKGFERREKALRDFNTNVDRLGFTAEQITVINSMGEENAAAFVAGYKKASPDQRKKLSAILTESAKTNSGDYLIAADKGLQGKTLKAPKVATPDLNVSQFMTDAQREIDRRPPLKIKVDTVDSRSGKKIG